MIRRIRLPLAAIVVSVVALVGAGSAAAAKPAADCQPYGAQPCLLPFPNNLFTKVDHASSTGRARPSARRGDAGQRRREAGSRSASTTAPTASAPAAR